MKACRATKRRQVRMTSDWLLQPNSSRHSSLFFIGTLPVTNAYLERRLAILEHRGSQDEKAVRGESGLKPEWSSPKAVKSDF